MKQTIIAFIVIVFLGSTLLYYFRKNLPPIISNAEFKKLQFLWIAITTAALFSYNYWVFVLIVLLFLRSNSKDRTVQFCSYIWLLPLLPLLPNYLPGFGGINVLLQLTFPRILALVILLPLFVFQPNRKMKFFRMPGDKIFFLYLLVNIFILTRDGGAVTNIMRSYSYLFLDVFLPYYAASRAFKEFDDFKKVAFIMFASIAILTLISLFTTAKSWHIYGVISDNLGIKETLSTYIYREGLLRARGPFSSPIVLGYVMVIGLGMGLAIKASLKNKKFFNNISILYALTLLATLSRGPWVGAMLLGLVFFTLSDKNKTKMIGKVIIAMLMMSALILLTNIGQKIFQLLPFVGTSSVDTVSYRQQLFENAWIVIKRSPFFGSDTYLKEPEMQAMIQGQGIIDIVNSYLHIAFTSGFVGVALFMLFFINLSLKLYLAQKKLKGEQAEIRLFAIALIATMISILCMIATLSATDSVAQFYWVQAGIISAFLYFLNHRTDSVTISKNSKS